MTRADDIKTDDDLVSVVNELKHRIKAGLPYSPMREAFNSALNEFIAKWQLGGDQHAFASMPERLYSESVERMISATEKCIDAGNTNAARANLDTLRAQLGDDDLKVTGLEVMLRFMGALADAT